MSKSNSQWEELNSQVGLTAADKKLIELEKDLISSAVKARKESNASQGDVSKRSSMKVTAVSRFENEKTDPRLSTVVKYLHAIGKRLDIVDEQKN